jgi:sarcosine oxidase, subunit gamma
MAARLGPNEWLLLGPEHDEEALARQIEAALAGRLHALVDIGHGTAAVEVSGRHAPDVLNAGCPLDLANDAFPTGSATRTLLGKAEIVLMRLDDAPTYRVECGRSFARYVHDFLLEAAREFEAPAR